MDPIFYPTREQLEVWVEYLKGSNNILQLSLPISDTSWFNAVLATIDRVNNSYISGVSAKAAHLFYYIIKDHNFIDGNKRSGIAVTYFFFFVNGYEIRNAERIRRLAKQLAKSHGSKKKEDWIQKIEKEFLSVCKPIVER